MAAVDPILDGLAYDISQELSCGNTKSIIGDCIAICRAIAQKKHGIASNNIAAAGATEWEFRARDGQDSLAALEAIMNKDPNPTFERYNNASKLVGLLKTFSGDLAQSGMASAVVPKSREGSRRDIIFAFERRIQPALEKIKEHMAMETLRMQLRRFWDQYLQNLQDETTLNMIENACGYSSNMRSKYGNLVLKPIRHLRYTDVESDEFVGNFPNSPIFAMHEILDHIQFALAVDNRFPKVQERFQQAQVAFKYNVQPHIDNLCKCERYKKSPVALGAA